jgi:predicted amidohydrolase
METIPGAVDTNRAKALRFASEALTHQPDLILFHEECLVGYSANYRDVAETKDGPTSKAFRSLLSGTDSHVLWGLTERDGDKIYIAATLVNAQGIQANYRKTHLWWHGEGLRDETKFYTAGNELVTFDIKGHKCGVMICYDGDFPEMTRCYANIGCSVLFWLNNRPSRGYDEVKEHADRNSMIMPTACCTGKDETQTNCPGGSNITNYDGSLITEIWNKEGVLYADIDPAAALLARAGNPWYRGRRPDLYSKYA